jgi:hypothetical protein
MCRMDWQPPVPHPPQSVASSDLSAQSDMHTSASFCVPWSPTATQATDGDALLPRGGVIEREVEVPVCAAWAYAADSAASRRDMLRCKPSPSPYLLCMLPSCMWPLPACVASSINSWRNSRDKTSSAPLASCEQEPVSRCSDQMRFGPPRPDAGDQPQCVDHVK